MNRRQYLYLAGALSLSAVMPTFAAAAPASNAQRKAVVIYYSRTGNTARMAESIAKATGADVLRLEIREPYAAEYNDMTGIARREVQSGARRELSTAIPDLSQYEVVFLGTPYWWGSASVPMFTFLQDHALDGKQVFPFITSGSSSPDGALRVIRSSCPKAAIGQHLHLTGSELGETETQVSAWLRQIGFVQ